MTYDRSSFLAGVAVGRQLKGWGAVGAARQGPGFYRLATGERELVNRQSESELNYIQLPAGVRYCTMYVPGGYMYLFAASPEEFTLHTYSNNTEEPIDGSGRIRLGEQIYYYAYADWHSPLPTPLVDCVAPVRDLSGQSLTADKVITQGILYLYGSR